MSAEIKPFILKSDLVGIVPSFTVNVRNESFDGANKRAHERLYKFLPATLYAAFETIGNTTYSVWDDGVTYNGEYVLYQNRLFLSILSGVNKNPVSQTTYWTEKEIFSLYRDYIKPFLCWQAYAYFLPFYGKEIDQAGLKEHSPQNSNFIPVDDAAKGGLVNHAQITADNYFSGFQNKLMELRNIIDGVTYTFTTEVTHKPVIRMFQA